MFATSDTSICLEQSEAFMPLSSEAEDAVDDALHHGNRYLILVSGNVVNMTKLYPGHFTLYF